MNRHQRRRQKKEQKVHQPYHQELVNIINIHSSQNFDLAEKEYHKLLKKIPPDSTRILFISNERIFFIIKFKSNSPLILEFIVKNISQPIDLSLVDFLSLLEVNIIILLLDKLLSRLQFKGILSDLSIIIIDKDKPYPSFEYGKLKK